LKVGLFLFFFSGVQLKSYVEDEPADDIDDYDEEPSNPLIDALFDEVEDLRLKVRLIFHHSNHLMDSFCRVAV